MVPSSGQTKHMFTNVLTPNLNILKDESHLRKCGAQMRQNRDITLYQSKKPTAVNAADSAGKLRSGRLLHVIHAVEKDSQKGLNVATATHLTLPLTLPHNDQSVAHARHIDIPLNRLLYWCVGG